MMQCQRKKKRMVAHPPKRRAMRVAFATSLVGFGGDASGRSTTVAAAEGADNETAAAKSATLKQLVTTYDSGHSAAGFMFDMKAKNDISIKNMDINMYTTRDTVQLEIYTKEGSWVGYETNEDAWTLWLNETIKGSSVLNKPTRIPAGLFASPLKLSADERRAFYVAFTDGPYLRYSKSLTDEQFYTNEDVILDGYGAAKRKGFQGGMYNPRLFNGALNYETIPPQPMMRPNHPIVLNPNEADVMDIIQTPTNRPVPEPSSQPTLQPTKSPTSLPTTSPTYGIRTFTTSFDSSATYAGHMFDLFAKENIEIQNIAFNTWKTDSIPIKLYMRDISYKGHDKDISGWTLLADVTVQGNGLDKPTYFPEGSFDPILIRRNKRMAFYITTTDGPYLRASKGTQSRANADLAIFDGVGKRYPINEASFNDRTWNGSIKYQVLDIPTLAPTTSAPSSRPTARPTQQTSRIRLYWQRGYYWQESWREMWWCMQCRGSCHPGDLIWIDRCGSSSRQQFTAIDETIRPTKNQNLCFTRTGMSEREPLRLQPCNDDRMDQKFVGFKPSGRFELQPKGMTDDDTRYPRCLSQMHHPKKGERVYPEECRKTRNHDTTYWNTY